MCTVTMLIRETGELDRASKLGSEEHIIGAINYRETNMETNNNALLEQAHSKRDETIAKLMAYGIEHNDNRLVVAVVGYWIWIEGEILKDRADIRGVLKALGYRYAPQKHAWSWTPKRHFGKPSGLALDQLAVKHGYSLATW